MKTFSSVSLQNINDGAAGAQGPQGVSVTKVVTEYCKSSSSTALPSNPNWSETEPTLGANEYLWARQRSDKSDGTSSYGPAICSVNISGIKSDVDKVNQSITDKVWSTDITTQINQYDGSTVSAIRDRVSTNEQNISGITTRVSDVESETDDLGTRMTTAETTIDQTANNVVIKATAADTTAAQGGQHLIQSLINVAPSGVTISADKVNIEGATIFSSGRLSQTSLNNAYDAKGSAAAVREDLNSDISDLQNQTAQQSELIIGTQTAGTYSWTGTSVTLSQLTDGMEIRYWLPFGSSGTQVSSSYSYYNGSSTSTGTNTGSALNLTLANGTKTGDIPIYYASMTRLTTHYPYGSVIRMIYRENVRVYNANTTYYTVAKGFWCDANYDSNTSYTQFSNAVTVGSGSVYQCSLIMKDSKNNTWVSIATSGGTGTSKSAYTGGLYFDKLVYSAGSGTYTSGNTTSTVYDSYALDLRYSTNCGTTLTTRKPVYLVGTVTNGKFYLNTSQWWTQTEPTSVDNKVYIYIGEAYSTYQVYLQIENPAYQYYDGAFRTLEEIETLKANNWIRETGQTAADIIDYWATDATSATTTIKGGLIQTHTITANQLTTDAIMSNNYIAGGSTSPYSAAGTFLDLSNGNFYTPNFGVQSLTGQAYLNGEIIATSGSIGDDSGNYWSIGNTTDSQGNGSASIVGNGTAFIQDGDWQIHSGLSNYSNGSINTQWYVQPQGQGLQLTYPYYDGYYYDYGMTSPVLDANADRFYNQTVSQNFLYIRKHASTIPALESDWNYIFRVDKDGMIWINGQSLTQMIQSGVDGGAYVPISGGTITGNLTVTGTLTATASKANQLTHSISVNGKAFDASADVTVGTIGATYGGTGQTSLKAAGTAIIGALDTNTTTPVDNDYIATGSSTFYRKTMSKLWDYIKGKLTNDHDNLDSLYVQKSGDIMTGSLTVENGIYSDSAQLGDLIVTGAGRFANGLYGNLIGNADTATKAAKVADSGNGTDTTFAYSKSGLTTASWVAAWNGYELRAISPANLKSTLAITKSDVGLGNVDNTADANKVVKGVFGIAGTANTNRHVWFSDTNPETSRNYDDNFMYNPSTNVLTVGSITGNAATSTTATKFNSVRTVALTGDVTGSASSDGASGWSIATTVQDNSHNHTPNNIIPGQMGLSGNLDPLTRTMIGSAASNKTFGLPSNAITIEYSTDGGSTWKDYEATDSHKKALFMELRTGCNTHLGKATTKEANSLNNQLRITIEPVDRYVGLDALYVWMSSQGNTVTVDLERSTIGAKDTYTTVFTGQALAGWPGNNIRYFTYGSFGGRSEQTSNYYKYRLTFKQTAINSNYPSANIYDIRFLGMNVFSVAKNIVTANHLYTWDTDFNAIFPAGITATSFTGNASSASKLDSTRSFTIGNTAKNVDWSGAVSFTKAEISGDASSTANGWMSVDDKKKLDSITVSDIGTIGANSIRGEKDIKVTMTSGVATIGHENSAITAGTISGTATSTLTNGGSFKIPSITYDAYGHITGTAQTTITLPNITSITGNAGTATKFSSTRAISLSGDVSGSATADGSSGWSITTTVADDSHNHTVDTIVPKLSKSYTGVIASANDDANCYLYCIKIVPDTYNGQWEIKYRVYADMDGIADSNGNGKEESIVYVSGMRNTYAAYRTWNNITNTSYRPYYYHSFRFINEANISYGHICGISLRYAYNPTTETYKRNVTFEVIDCKNCTVSFFDSPLVYADIPSTGNYSGITNFDATTQGNTMSGDRNDANYQLRAYYSNYKTYAATGRYKLMLSKDEEYLIPINSTDNDLGTSKTLTTEAFDPFGEIFYYSYTNRAANTNFGNGELYRQYMFDLRYSFNCGGNTSPASSTLVARKALYLVATPQSNGTAKLYSQPLSQDLPTSDNGLIYIYLGQVYADTDPYRVDLSINHPVYWYKNGAVRQFVQRAETANSATTAESATKANYANNLLAYNSNEITIGANNSTAGSSTNNAIWFNYRDVQGGSTTNDSTQITHYYFGNRKGAVTGVNVHAANFVGDLTGNASTASSATRASQDDEGHVIKTTYAEVASPTFTGIVTSPYYISTQNMTISAGKITELTTAPRSGLFANGVGITNPATRNDVGWIRMLGTGESDTIMEIATGDDASEQIFVRQYNTSSAVVHELKLLDASGNTSVPGTLKVGGHVTLSYSSTTESLDFIFN